jgi:tetratricopeptide (TPR) repeat protein
MRLRAISSLMFTAALAGVALLGQERTSAPKPAGKAVNADRAAAYYHYALGHLYGELAGMYGNRGEYLNQAIDNYRQALKADPGSTIIASELSDLYIQAGRLREAVSDSEAALRENPNDVNARRILGRIYMRLVGDTRQGRIDQTMVKKAIEQYQKIAELVPTDIEAWLILGRLHKVAQNSVESEAAFKRALEIDPENEDALTGLAMVYSDLGDGRRASELLAKVVEKSPNLRTLTSLAAAYEQMREYALAAETLRRASELAPENGEIKRAMAQNYLLADQIEEALGIYEQLVKEDPRDAQSHLRLSQIYRQQRKFDKAREANEEAKRLDPGNLEAIYNDVNIYEAEGRNEEAVRALKELLDSTVKGAYTASEKANRAIFLERLGLLYRRQHRTEDAVKVFQELGALDEEQYGARSAAQVIDTWRQAHELKRALAESEAAIKKYPKERVVLVTRASVLADAGRVDEAVAEVKKLLDGANDREVWLTLAQVYEKGKKYQEMGKAIDEAERLSVNDEDKEIIYFMRGAMYEKMKDFEASEAQFRKVLEINPDSASALNYLGYMLADRNVRLEEALEMIQKAVDQEPNNGAYLDSLGWVYYRLGKLEDAEHWLKRALATTDRDPAINDHLGDVYFKQGRLRDAISQWEIALRLWNSAPPSEHDPEQVAEVERKLEGAKVRLARENLNQ